LNRGRNHSDIASAIGAVKGIHHVFKNIAMEKLALVQRLPGLNMLGDILRGAKAADRLACIVANDFIPTLNMTNLTTGQYDPAIDGEFFSVGHQIFAGGHNEFEVIGMYKPHECVDRYFILIRVQS